jgi:hypothetical protein
LPLVVFHCTSHFVRVVDRTRERGTPMLPTPKCGAKGPM